MIEKSWEIKLEIFQITRQLLINQWLENQILLTPMEFLGRLLQILDSNLCDKWKQGILRSKN